MLEAEVAARQQAAASLVERARSLAARLEQERADVLAGARQEAEEECERLKSAAQQECRRLLQEAEERHAWLTREAGAMTTQHAIQDSMVTLDVGGRVFTTSVHTLRSVPGSMLDSMFSGRFGVKRTAEQRVFIDRDGSLFGHVLGYLRDRVVDLDQMEAAAVRRLKREFSFFGIEVGWEAAQEYAFVTGGVSI